MPILDLPYLPRPDLENELREFLLSRLKPRPSTTKSILIAGPAEVGKMTLVKKVIQGQNELKQYDSLVLDMRDLMLQNLNEQSTKPYGKLYESAVEVLKESSPYPLRLLIAIAHIFSKDKIFKSQLPTVPTTDSLADYLFLRIEKHPTLLIVHGFDAHEPEHCQMLAHLVNVSYERAASLAILLLSDLIVVGHDMDGDMKNVRRFLKRDDCLQHLVVSPLNRATIVSSLTTVGLSEQWAEILFQFSEGYPSILSYIWRHLQKKDVLQAAKDGQWTTTDAPAFVLSQEFVREVLYRLLEHKAQTAIQSQRDYLADGLLMAASMGETFLPQIVVECILPPEREFTDEDKENLEDLWYEILEQEGTDTSAIARQIVSNERPEILPGDGRTFFVYTFSDTNWRTLLNYMAKRLCDPIKPDKAFRDNLERLDNWLQGHFQNNWQAVLSFRVNLGETVHDYARAKALRRLQSQLNLIEKLPQQIETERKLVARGGLAGNLYGLLLWFGDVLQDTGEYPESLNVVLEAKELFDQHKIALDSMSQARLFDVVGNCYYHNRNHAAAESLYRDALAIYERKLGTEHPDVARNLDNLANSLEAQCNYAAAEPLFHRALAIYERKLGPEHPNVAGSLNSLALSFHVQGNDAAAEPLFRRALAIYERELGPEHPDVARNLDNLANSLKAQGNLAAAEPLFLRALAIFEKQLGPEHPDIAINLNSQAELLEAQGNHAAAEPLYRRALAIYERKLGPEHPAVATSLNNLAVSLRAQGNYAAAEPLFRRALAICERELGPEHRKTKITRKNLDFLQKQMH